MEEWLDTTDCLQDQTREHNVSDRWATKDKENEDSPSQIQHKNKACRNNHDCVH
jgi:hypothetical protein